MGLLALSSELLTLILEEVGGRELRRDVNKLLVSRRWNAIAQPVYLSGLDVRNVREHGCTIIDRPQRFWHSDGERRLVQKNTKTFRVRLRGHWWDEETKEHYEGLGDELDDEPQAKENVSIYGYPVFADQDEQMLAWRNSTNLKLKALARDLHGFDALEDLLIQAGFDTIEAFGRPWAYLRASTLDIMLPGMPIVRSLNTLTLDLYAGLVEDTSPCSERKGICSQIAAILPLIPKVRVRLKKSCAALFTAPNDIDEEMIRLRSLVVKLHMPYHNSERGDTTIGPFCCDGGPARSQQHYRAMIQGSRALLNTLSRRYKRTQQHFHEGKAAGEAAQKSLRKGNGKKRKSDQSMLATHCLERLRISWPGPQGSCNIYTADILANRTFMPHEEFFIHEDEGYDCWDYEERTDLKDCGSLDEELHDENGNPRNRFFHSSN